MVLKHQKSNGIFSPRPGAVVVVQLGGAVVNNFTGTDLKIINGAFLKRRCFLTNYVFKSAYSATHYLYEKRSIFTILVDHCFFYRKFIAQDAVETHT